MFNNTNTMY